MQHTRTIDPAQIGHSRQWALLANRDRMAQPLMTIIRDPLFLGTRRFHSREVVEEQQAANDRTTSASPSISESSNQDRQGCEGSHAAKVHRATLRHLVTGWKNPS